MSEPIEPTYLVAKNVIQQANQFKNVHILNNDDNIPPQYLLPIKQQIVELKSPPLPLRQPIRNSSKHLNRQKTIQQINQLKERSKLLYDNLREFFSLSTELTFRLVILFVIYISIIYNLYRSLAALYLIESNFRHNYHYVSPVRRTIYSVFMLFNLFVDCYGVLTLLRKSVLYIFLYAICLTGFSLFLLILFGSLASMSVTLSLLIASLCYLFTYVEYRQCQPETAGVCQQCVHHINHV